MLAAAVASCTKETTPERINIQHPDQQSPILRDNAYYQNLRAYKQTKHKLAFGWYGSWTAVGASYQSRLISAPDSMDIISIWSQWHTLTPQQMADKEFVQKTLGTKVTYTIFSDKLPEPFLEIGNGEYTDEAIEAYAKAYCKDSMDKYQYDGIDIDYEPGYGASGPFVGHDNALFTKLINAMSKYVGPKSGTGRLLIIDGVPYAVDRSVVDCFDYGIVQAYASSGYTDLQNRFNNADAKGWKPEQYIFAENFESYWKTGGVNFTDREGNRMPSLYGMATFNPTQGAGAGFGAYHMEYEYGNSAMPYQFMRNAIQMANPAGGWKTPIDVAFSSNQSSNFSFVVEDDGSVTGTMQDKVSLSFSRPVVSGMQLTLGVDNSLVAVYNDENGTEYETVDPSLVKMEPIQCAENQVFSPDATITLDPKSIEKGYYLIPVVISPISDAGYAVKEGSVHYIFVTKVAMDVEIGATTLDGSKIAPTSAWTITCCQGTATSGATGVWNCDERRHRCLELRLRRAEGGHVRRQARRQLLVCKQRFLFVGQRRQLHHRHGRSQRRDRPALAYLLSGFRTAVHRPHLQRRRQCLVQPFGRRSLHSGAVRQLEVVQIQENGQSPLYPGLRGSCNRPYEHERSRNLRPGQLAIY